MADQDRFARALTALARGLARVQRERARTTDLTPQQTDTLVLIAERGAVSTSVLATLLGIDPSTASRNLSGLERAGLINRKKGADDARQTDVRLTPRGRRVADSMDRGATQALGSAIDRIPRAERNRTIDVVEQLAEIFGAEV